MRKKLKASDIVKGLRLVNAGQANQIFTMGDISQYSVGSSPTRGGYLFHSNGDLYENRKYNCASLQSQGFTLAPPAKPAE